MRMTMEQYNARKRHALRKPVVTPVIKSPEPVKKLSALEESLLMQIMAVKLPTPVRELRFAPPRRFRFDFAWPDKKLAVEVNGAHWVGGRHNTGSGMDSDCEKYALAVLDGWRVITVTSTHINSGEALQWIERALK